MLVSYWSLFIMAFVVASIALTVEELNYPTHEVIVYLGLILAVTFFIPTAILWLRALKNLMSTKSDKKETLMLMILLCFFTFGALIYWATRGGLAKGSD